MTPIHCAACGEATPGYDIVSFRGSDEQTRDLCTRCFNAEVARLKGPDNFEDLRFEPVVMKDCAGVKHQFHFQTRLLGGIVSLEAFELQEGNRAGYQFQLVDDSNTGLLALLGRLIEKVRRALATRHITDDVYGLHIADQTVRGRIEWDSAKDGRTPIVVVDGREISWDQLGGMLMTFEGWQFKLDILDPSAEA